MRRKIRAVVAAAATWWLAAAMLAAFDSVPAAADNPRWGANYFPNVTLTTQDGATVRFYDDLLKGKIVAINLIYTTCQYACPLETARMAQVQKLLGDRMGRDVFFYSITIDPEHDTPAVLKEYGGKFHAGPGWLFLTGKQADIELISRKLGIYSAPNPSNPDGHLPYLLVGNEVTGQWMRNSAVDNAGFLARTIGDWLNSWQNAKDEGLKSYAEVPARLTFDRGQYTFTNHCAACHTIGRGEHVGPDLLGVTDTRDRRWLARFIVAPDRMNAEGDPIAVALRAQYKQVRMPNLDLTSSDAAVLIDYMDRQSRAVRAAAGAAESTKTGTAPITAAVDLMPIVNPYLRIQQALHGDTLEAVKDAARSIASEAAKFGSSGASIQSAAGKFQQAVDLKAARALMGKLSDAILIYAKESNAKVGDDVKVAYCPMAQKYWLQTGEKIQNPYFGRAMSDCGRISPDIPSLKK
jgi:protein SCO1/2